MADPVRRVLALIIDYQNHEEAAAFSLQLARLPRTGYQLTVAHVDNGSPTPHLATTEQIQLGVLCPRNQENHGYAGGINAAAMALDPQGDQYDAYWILNSDFWVEPDCLDRLVQVLDEHPEVAAAGPRVYLNDTPRVWGARGAVSPWLGITRMTDWPRSGPLPRWSYLPGCSILTRASAFHELGGFPNRYRLYFEETDYCIQLQKRGYQLWVEKDAIAHHRVQSMHAGVPARHFAFYFARNNLFFWRENFGIPWFIQLPRTLFVIFKELVLPLRRAQSLAEARDRAGYIWAGFIDGFEFLKTRFTQNEKRLFLK